MFDAAARQRGELESLRAEVRRLRDFVGDCIERQERLVETAVARAREALEARIEIAAGSAMAFARHELSQYESRLRQLSEMRGRAQESFVRAGEALEARIDLAAREAIAFAEQGLSQQQAALRTLGRRVAELAREPRAEVPWAAQADPPAGACLIGRFAAEWRDFRRLDVREESEEVFLADLADLPIPPGGATRLAAVNVVEFAPEPALAEVLLPHWRERLAPGGELAIVTLDGPAWTADLAEEAADFERMRARLASAGPRPVRSLFDFETLRRLLQAAGFPEVERAAGKDRLELRVVARAAP